MLMTGTARVAGCLILLASGLCRAELRPSQRHAATRIAYGPCHSGTEVVLWKLAGAGHVWPGGDIDYLTWALGPGTDVIDANTQMWRFFSRFRLDQ